MLQIDRLIEKSKSSITIKSFFACENSTLDGKGKGEEGKSSDIDQNKADDVLDSGKDKKEEKTENNDNDSLLLYNMQFCILRVLKSNFLRQLSVIFQNCKIQTVISVWLMEPTGVKKRYKS